MPKLPRQTVLLTEPLKEWLAVEAKRIGISVNDLIRRLLEEARRSAINPNKPTGDAP